MQNISKDIPDYIRQFSPEIRERLQWVRETIQAATPSAVEAIKYAMPTFVQLKSLVHFAAFKIHIGFFPAPSGVNAFAKELSEFKIGNGSIQFPFDQPSPPKPDFEIRAVSGG